ncbi:uncharacterized protein EDB91DRAFT_32462 [Suillus paluster]|uniref:uncharacterized protein n=1 Tax=Suillus paluster TaxID=48578 RepID=UPI001B8865DD|nr:uncharacterized protein EDB91DRAFT_32462 [Suillus paluster]KAG1756720.1 hypothetical protein EDB91DRAFT_32462 [Suillus paluster]
MCSLIFLDNGPHELLLPYVASINVLLSHPWRLSFPIRNFAMRSPQQYLCGAPVSLLVSAPRHLIDRFPRMTYADVARAHSVRVTTSDSRDHVLDFTPTRLYAATSDQTFVFDTCIMLDVTWLQNLFRSLVLSRIKGHIQMFNVLRAPGLRNPKTACAKRNPDFSSSRVRRMRLALAVLKMIPIFLRFVVRTAEEKFTIISRMACRCAKLKRHCYPCCDWLPESPLPRSYAFEFLFLLPETTGHIGDALKGVSSHDLMLVLCFSDYSYKPTHCRHLISTERGWFAARQCCYATTRFPSIV